MARLPPVESLYALPLADFVRARDALAARRDARGDRNAGAAIRALCRPSLAAWALNRLVHTRGGLWRAFVAASRRLAGAQERHLRDRADDGFAAATRAQRACLGAAEDGVRAILQEGGHPASPAILERVARVLRAAAGNAALRDHVEGGCLAALPEDDPTAALLAASASAATAQRQGGRGRARAPASPRPPPTAAQRGHGLRTGEPHAPQAAPAPRRRTESPDDELNHADPRRAEVRALVARIATLRGEGSRARSTARAAERRIADARAALAEAERAAAGTRRALTQADAATVEAVRRLQRQRGAPPSARRRAPTRRSDAG